MYVHHDDYHSILNSQLNTTDLERGEEKKNYLPDPALLPPRAENSKELSLKKKMDH
jgi:hypothetical protein